MSKRLCVFRLMNYLLLGKVCSCVVTGFFGAYRAAGLELPCMRATRGQVFLHNLRQGFNE